MHQGEYDPSRQSPFRARPHASPQYVGTQYPDAAEPAPQPEQAAVPAEYAHYWTPGREAPLRQSGLGVASFLLSLVSVALLVVSITAAVVMANQSGGKLDQQSGKTIAAGLGIIVGLGMTLLGTVLGAISLAQSDRKKVFAILGLTFNLLLLVVVGGMMVYGIVKK